MYEHRKHPLISRAEFSRRVACHFTLAFLALTIALGMGILGYHYLGGLKWVDSLLNASMILVGWGLSIIFILRPQRCLLPPMLCFPGSLLLASPL